MLKKLKYKFILINMIFVTIMLAAIFGLLYFSTSQNLERDSIKMMEDIAVSHIKPNPFNKSNNNIHLPYFSVMVDKYGKILETEGNSYLLSDIEQLSSILLLAKNSKMRKGVLNEYKIRFLRSETPLGESFVFVDMTYEYSTLQNLFRTFSIVGITAFILFFIISVFLARWAVKPVELAWQQQKQFVADASHELKTPLTVIMTDAELLHAPDCPDEDREPLSKGILTMTSQMRGLVENLLDLARIDNGTVKEDFNIVFFSDIVLDAVMMFEPLFFENKLYLQYDIEPNICINGISSHLKQIVSILLDNAEKYSLQGGKISVKLVQSAHKHVLLEVSNQGESISKDDLKNIFKRFYRMDKARVMNHSYGLGLSIALSIAQEHHGKIWAESKDGYNSFYVELPCLDK